MTAELVLGTANFGLRYGIANNRMLSQREAFVILEKALDVGVCWVDTARGYGEAEKVLGRFFRAHGKLFDVVTKLPDGEYRSAEDVEMQINRSLETMGIDQIDVLLLHSFKSLDSCKEVLLPVLEQYLSEGLVGRYGLSVYHPHEVETALAMSREDGFHIAAIQFPLNLFDQRFLKGDLLQRLRASGITLYARSIFLQGLFFVGGASLAGHLVEAGPKIRHLETLARMHDISIEGLALLFAISSDVDYVVLGVDSVAQLEKDAALMAADTDHVLPKLKTRFDMLEVPDEDIILPYKWKQ
ncbi:MAG TPA: aldo/keto reductase [Syntrophorhabdales bacterium]|nr:aldo/keto reductase [Syntrophorhabdales bacterium]